MKNHSFIIVVICLFAQCEINQKDLKPEDEFVKIYNDPDETSAYYPLSIIQTEDKGYLILTSVKNDTSETGFPVATILKVNSIGTVLNTISTSWLAPSPHLINLGGSFAFVATNQESEGFLVYVNPDNAEITRSVALDLPAPLACITDKQGNMAVLGYDNIANSSIIKVYNSEVAQIKSTELKVIDPNAAGVILYHMNKTGSEFPFYIGEWQNQSQNGYFVNCLANYTLRTVFFNNNLSPVGGDIFSFQDRDALSSFIHLFDNNFAFTRYYGGNNYISVNVEVDPTASQNFNDLTQNKLTELIPEARVVSEKVMFNSTEYLLFASTTNSNSIVIYQYAIDNIQELVKTKYFDFENKIEIMDMIQDKNDEGIVILGRVYLTGRYLRPIVIKFKKEDFVN